MTSTRTIERAEFQNPPLRELLLNLSYAFKVLYIPPPRRDKIGPPGRKAQQTGDSYETELENYKEELRFLNSDKDSNWMEVYFEEAIQFPVDECGPTGYVSNQMEPPPSAIANTKRKYTDMTSSNIRYNQGGIFLLADQSAEAEAEGQDVTMNEGVDYDESGSSSRRRFN
jgi:hypothetical protein